MSDIKNNIDGFYNKIFATYKPEDYFDEIEIKINYYKNIEGKRESERKYKILSLSLDKKNSTRDLNKIDLFIKGCNEKLLNTPSTKDWQLFYLYKELLQFFTHSNNEGKNVYNYFRGQSHSYSLAPNILRKEVEQTYRNEFENLYLKISHELLSEDNADINKEELKNYLVFLENEKLEDSKKQCLKDIKDELSQKLREFCYFEEDLFPDFETRIRYLSSKYDSNTSKKISL